MRSLRRLHGIQLRLALKDPLCVRYPAQADHDVRRDRVQRTPRTERGAAVVELLLLGMPLCVLAMVLASKLAATSSARLQAQWTASQIAQLDTREPCGIDFLLTAGPVAAVVKQPKAAKALLPLAGGADLLFTNSKTRQKTIDIADYHFRASADQAVPDGIKSVRAEAAFLCNNSTNRGKNGLTKDNARTVRGIYVTGLGFWQARKLFSGGGKDIKEPKDPREKPSEDAKEQGNQLPKGDPKDSIPDELRDRIHDADKKGVPKSSSDRLGDLPPDIRKDVDDELKKRPQLEDPKPKKN